MPKNNSKLKVNPTEITFAETMEVIEKNYNFTPISFSMGDIKNKVRANSSSCKLFGLAFINNSQKRKTKKSTQV